MAPRTTIPHQISKQDSNHCTCHTSSPHVGFRVPAISEHFSAFQFLALCDSRLSNGCSERPLRSRQPPLLPCRAPADPRLESSQAGAARGRESPPALRGLRVAGEQGQLGRRPSQPERRQQPAGQRRPAPPAPRRVRHLSVRAGGPDVADEDHAADAGHDGQAVRRHGGVPHGAAFAGGGERGAADAVGHHGGREGGEDAVRHARADKGGGEGDGGGRHARHPRRAQEGNQRRPRGGRGRTGRRVVEGAQRQLLRHASGAAG